jgi:kynurenine formamidase
MLEAALDKRELQNRIVLLYTGWGELRARNDEWLFHAPFLSPDGAHFLARNKVRGVGIDAYSIGGAREPANAQTHQILLQQNIWICEELRFPKEALEVSQPATFLALPIHLREASGAPCRPFWLSRVRSNPTVLTD